MTSGPRHLRDTNLEHRGWLAGSLVLLLLLLAGMGTQRNWWSPNLQLSFRTTSAAGIQPGMAVMISGYPVGRVQRIRLLNDAQVQVTLRVGKAQQPMLGPRSRATLAQDSLLGSPYIAITPDLHHNPGRRNAIAQNGTLIYDPSPSMASLIKDLAASRVPLQQVMTSSAKLVEQRVPRSLDQLDRTLSSGERLADGLERELVGRAGRLQSGVDAATGKLEATLASVQTTLGEIQALARSSNSLLQSLSRSWLLRLLDPAPADARRSDG